MTFVGMLCVVRRGDGHVQATPVSGAVRVFSPAGLAWNRLPAAVKAFSQV